MDSLDAQGFIEQRRLPDQRKIAVQPLLFGRAQLGIGPKPPMHEMAVYDDSWDFPTVSAARTQWNTSKARAMYVARWAALSL